MIEQVCNKIFIAMRNIKTLYYTKFNNQDKNHENSDDGDGNGNNVKAGE